VASKGLVVGGIGVLAVGMFIGGLAYMMLNNERIDWWNAQMKLTYDQAMGNEYQVSMDEYNITVAQTNIWEAQGRMMAGLLIMILGVGVVSAGSVFKK
jgi:hypothetical protein